MTKSMVAPEPLDVCRLDMERCVLLWSEVPHLASCDPLAPRFPTLVFFVRLLAVRHLDMAEPAAELLSLYAMGWHCRDAPRDVAIDFVEYAAGALLAAEDQDGADRLYEFESQFTLFLRHDPALKARYMHPSWRPGAVVLDV